MQPTRRTQPLRKSPGRLPGGGLAAALRGRTLGGYNPQDARRRAMKRRGGTTTMQRREQSMPTFAKGFAKAVAQRPTATTGRPGVRGGKVKKPMPARTHEVADGSKRRLSFKEAYLRRTTDTSRARVEAKYGRKAGSKLRDAATSDVKVTPLPTRGGQPSARGRALAEQIRERQAQARGQTRRRRR